MTSVLVIRVTDYGVKMVDVVQVIETILRVFYAVSITFSFSWFVFCRISVTTVLLLPTYSRNICSSLVAFPLIITPQVNL